MYLKSLLQKGLIFWFRYGNVHTYHIFHFFGLLLHYFEFVMDDSQYGLLQSGIFLYIAQKTLTTYRISA